VATSDLHSLTGAQNTVRLSVVTVDNFMDITTPLFLLKTPFFHRLKVYKGNININIAKDSLDCSTTNQHAQVHKWNFDSIYGSIHQIIFAAFNNEVAYCMFPHFVHP